jgi:hypothetical protein
VREYELTYLRKRRWRFRNEVWDTKWQRTVTEDTNTHDALPDVEDFDEICKCNPKAIRLYDGYLCFDMGRASFRVPYRLTRTGFLAQIEEKIVDFSFSDYERGVSALDSGLTISVPIEFIPAPLTFLCGLTGELIDARTFKYLDAGIEATGVENLESQVSLEAEMITTPSMRADVSSF